MEHDTLKDLFCHSQVITKLPKPTDASPLLVTATLPMNIAEWHVVCPLRSIDREDSPALWFALARLSGYTGTDLVTETEPSRRTDGDQAIPGSCFAQKRIKS